jgi:cytochrome bd-type quinol oxidase subunit 2
MTGSSDKSRALCTMVVLELLLLVSFWAAQRSLFPFLVTNHSGAPLLLEQALARDRSHTKN